MSISMRYPLTAYQRDIWTIVELFPGLPSYLSSVVGRFSLDIDVDAMVTAIERTWARNDGLRLRFRVVDGVPFQELSTEPMPAVQVIDVSDAADPHAEALRRVHELTGNAIELVDAVPFRAHIVRAGADRSYVLVTTHHIAADATGLFNIGAQILTDYAGITTTGDPFDLPGSSFLGCLDFERDYRASEQYGIDRDALVDRLRATTPALFERPRATGGLAPVTSHTFTLERALVDRIRAAGVSLYPYFCAMLGLYLSRVLRTHEIAIGIPFGNRHNPTEQSTIGHFANTLPLPIDTGGHATVRDLVAAVKADVRQMKPHERYPLGDLMGELRRAGNPARQLFDVTVAYPRLPDTAGLIAGLEEVQQPSQGYSPLAMAWTISEIDDDGPLLIRLDYATDIFDADYPIESAAAHLTALLYAGIDALDSDPALLPMLSAAEYDALVDRERATTYPYDAQASVIGRITEQAARTPGAVAVHAADGATISYGDLLARVAQLSGLLRESGVSAGDLVAVVLERGPDMLVAMLAAMHAGAAYVPVDPGYPADRIAYVLADSAAKVVLTDAARAETIEDAVTLTPERWSAGAHAAAPVPDGSDLAYVIYTSGSTGHPKGVAVEHHSVINRLAWMQRRYPLRAGDVILQKTPSSFDVSVWELFWWALEGAQVALLRPGGEKDPREILSAIADSGVTVMHFVPSMLTPFLDLLEADPAAVSQASGLRTVFCSGEALLPHQVTRWNRAFAGLGSAAPRLVNLYGPTEATVDVSYHDTPQDPARPVTRVPIGRPIDNTRLYILGPADQPQPLGVAGELCIAGVGLARGYLHRPELNAEKFVADPFHPGERMYRTGDLVRRLADGEIEYLGRIDRQVKIRGNRIELGEVENALAALPGITAAAVIDHHSPSRGAYLAAYCVATEGLEPANLRAGLARTLPEYMIPAQFVRIDAIPLTPSGKADRTALAAIRPEADAAEQTAPRTPVEQQLAQVWCEVLDRESVSVFDNFYDLGGDSILLLRVRARAEARGLLISARDIAESPTIAELAERARTGAVVAAPIEPFALVPGIDRARLGHVEDAYPLTRLQLGMLFHSRERAESSLYHDVFRYSLRMPWDEAEFRAALRRSIARHPMLRTSFDLAAYSEPLQLVHGHLDAPLTITDLRGAEPDTAETAVREHVAERRLRPYVFDQPGLFHLAVFRLADRIDIVLSFHHAILDGWSVATLLSELLADYRGIGDLSAGELPSFAEYVRAERESIADPADREFWARELDGAETARIPGARPHGPVTPDSAAGPVDARVSRTIPVPAELLSRADAVAAATHVPVKSVLLAAHVATVGLLSGRTDVTTGVVTHGRPERLDAERMAGLFLNTMPLRIDFAGRSRRDLLTGIFDRDRNSAPHKRFPLTEIQRALGVVLDTAFNYVHFHAAGAALEALDVTLLGIDIREDTNFALLVNAVRNPLDGTLALRIDGDPAAYTREQLDSIGETYLAVLKLLTGDPAAPVDFGALAPAPAAAPGPIAPGTVLDLFDATAARTPDAIALEFGSRTVTYAQLLALSNRIATALVARGARPGDRIAMAVDRSPELVATVLGIAKAGAACVPLDVTYPQSRLHAMLEQARPFAVVTGPGHESLVPQQHSRIGLDDLVTAASTAALPAVAQDGTAYVLFTSGSTGTPKGVAMPHRALVNLIRWQLSTASGWLSDVERAPATTQFAPLSFDVSFQEIYSTLCGGGRLILLGEEQRRDLPALARLLGSTAAERIFLPYVALQQLAEAAIRLDIAPASLRVIISSGEQLRVTDEIRALCAAGTGVVLENQYGPTETHVATRYTMTGDPARFPVLPPIGRAVDNVEILVLDEQLRPVPDGVPGEIHLGGAALADGYEHRPDLTDAAFGPHPFAPGRRLYRTGDIGRRLPGGDVISDGRRGGQVKIRGHRVEPMEVELALQRVTASVPGVSEVAVVAHATAGASSAQTLLVGFLVGTREDVDEPDILAGLREWLPDYMIPSRLVWLDALPLTPSGKRADAVLAGMALPAPQAADRVAPRTPVEAGLAALMAEALGLPEVGIHDDFFALGGTSLTAMRLIVSIEQRFGLSLPVSALVTGPTVAALARHLDERAGAGFDPLVPLREGSGIPLFLVHPIGGNVLCYVELSKRLPANQPLYGLQAAGLEPGSTAAQSIPEMASNYIAALRRVQPEGPYHLGGWSLGGMVAFEMAQQLRESGHEVGMLALVDTMTVRHGDGTPVPQHSLYEFFLWELLWLARGADTAVIEIPLELESEDEVFDFILDSAVEAGVLPPAGSRALVRRLFEVFTGGWRAIDSYRPHAYEGDITLLRAAEPLPEVLRPAHDSAGTLHRDPTNGWDAYAAGHLEVIEVPGDHLTLIQAPHVAAVAAQLTRLLEHASATAS
ncbi:non-ribosomal peptide synthetase [Nocardia huaxiensis]|uniref:non-ribosomal peptide synthetase n=1 Tax=Nocardia huaxiensis TaxID=2755382 RepID=UPI001E624137|nr:non-ribosomal peptide synthetase [Nocardia huaxiensis]UFS98674.1 amino acid adenylation domain-containing protein [Nocardia huaxiensis]